MDVETTTLPEESQEVDASILLCHKIFALANPSAGVDVAQQRPRLLRRGADTV